tara:strand:+ start:224 stop:430 length:207 start_codon:yes stop_codon:yes gene_type:complete
MPKYRISGLVTGGKYLGEVDADNEEQAEMRGWKLPDAHVSVCHQCSSEIDDPEITQLFVEEIKEGEGQ